MKRILNFVVILLTTLSIVNAVNIPLRKRVTTFAACKEGAPEFNGPTVTPDPPTPGEAATAKFSITLQAPLEGGQVITDATDAGGESIGGFPTNQDVCTMVTCPVATGSTIDFETPLAIPDDAPGTYTLQYQLVDGAGKQIACSSGPVTGPAGGAKGKAPPDGAKAPDDGGGKGPGDGGDDGGPPDDGAPKGAKGKGGPGDDGAPKGAKGKGGPGDDGAPGPKGGKAGPDDGPGGPGGPAGPDDGPGGPGGPDGGPDDGPGGPP